MKKSVQSNLLLLSIVVALLCVPLMLISSGQYLISIFLPITYTIVLGFFVFAVNGRKISITSLCFFAMGFLRYVIVPIMGSLTDYYSEDTKLITSESLNIALVLMIIELVCAGVFLAIMECRKKRETIEEKTELSLYGTKWGYIIFIVMAVLVYFTIGRNMDLKISFLILSAGEDRTSDAVGTMVSLVNLIISAALFFVTVITINKFKNKYNFCDSRKKRNKYVVYSILFALIPICVIFGERRVSVLNVAIGYMVLLSSIYPDYKWKIIKRLSLGAGIIILLMTLYKTLTVFLYESYDEAMRANDMNLINWVCQLDSYFYGIKTVARNVTFASTSGVNIFNAIYDIFRNTFGFSFFLKDGLTTSELFNMYRSGGEELTGTLFSSCGYAYCYVGFLGSFIDICVKLGIMLKIEKIMSNTKYYEWKYVWGYLYSVFAYFMFGSVIMQINSVTRFLFCYTIFIFCSSVFRNNAGKYRGRSIKEHKVVNQKNF